MIEEPTLGPQPIAVVLVSANDWTSLALGAALRRWGVTTARAVGCSDAVSLVRAQKPDALLVDLGLPEPEWRAALTTLQATGAISPATPIVRFAWNDVPPQERLAALAAGAWDVVQLPIDTEGFRLRLATWVRASRHVDELDRMRFLDHSLPVYNARGLLRRARELGADSARANTPLACVAVALETTDAAAHDETGETPLASQRYWAQWHAAARQSDVIGRVGRHDFVVLAPRTGRAGGRALVERLRASLGDDGHLRAAVEVLEPASLGGEDAVALVSRAIAQLPRSRGTNEPAPVVRLA